MHVTFFPGHADTPGVYACKIVCKICTKYLHTCASIDYWCTSYTYRCAWLFMRCTCRHTNRHASDYQWQPSVQGMCIYSHTQHARTCAHWLYAYEHSYFGRRRKSYVSWDYIPGRCQETPAGGFYITMLLLIEIFAIISVSVGFQIPKLLEHIGDMYLSTSSAERLEFSWDGLECFLELSFFWMVSRLLMMGWKRGERFSALIREEGELHA